MHVHRRGERDSSFQHQLYKGVQILSDLTHKTKPHVHMHSHTSKITKKILRNKREKHTPMLRWMEKTHTYNDREPLQNVYPHSEGSKGHQNLDTCYLTGNMHISVIYPLCQLVFGLGQIFQSDPLTAGTNGRRQTDIITYMIWTDT